MMKEPKAILFDMDTNASVDVTKECLEDSEFWWTDGNMSCDCNRAMFFEVDAPCGNDRFRLLMSNNFPWGTPIDQEAKTLPPSHKKRP